MSKAAAVGAWGRGRGRQVFIIHFVLNVAIVAVELALVAAVGWLAWKQPLVLAALTTGLALFIGARLEVRRLAFEMPFYFDRSSRLGRILRVLIGVGQATLKAVVAGIVALMTFSGTVETRVQIMAGIFAAVVFVGSMLLRRMTISLGAKPANWGFFRMAVPLGLIFSAAMSLFPPPSSVEVARRVLLDLPARPAVAQAAEALFALRLWIDDLIVRLMATYIGADWAKIVGIALGSNVLVGFVLAVFVVVISEVIRVLEEAHWRMQRLGPPPR
jgi:hypothetical protein